MNSEQKFIEIPFGANDSELKGWEYTIPEGMEAIIKDGKVIVKEKESEDERIRKALLCHLNGLPFFKCNGITKVQMIDYLEKQKEQDKCPEYCVKSHCMGCPIYEKQTEQKPAEWSEEDEIDLNDAIKYIQNYGETSSDEYTQLRTKEIVEWLKSLHHRFSLSSWGEEIRDAFFGIERNWKPSEEQMAALKEASTSWMNEKMGNAKILESLYEQLNAL